MHNAAENTKKNTIQQRTVRTIFPLILHTITNAQTLPTVEVGPGS